LPKVFDHLVERPNTLRAVRQALRLQRCWRNIATAKELASRKLARLGCALTFGAGSPAVLGPQEPVAPARRHHGRGDFMLRNTA